MSHTLYPGADTKSQDFSGAFPASKMDTNCLLLHSTEGTGWPSYGGGATAPHMTVMPDFDTQTVEVRQHLPANKSARALENRSGGVETNTLNIFQIELVGTCDPATHEKWGSTPHIYMPEAPDWFLAGVADVVKWLAAEYPKFQPVDGAPRGWVAYPDSYGLDASQRMTAAEWLACHGIVGHQHAPENGHGDPGAFPIGRLVELATGATVIPAEPSPPPDIDLLDPANYPPDGPSSGQQITWLGERLVKHGFGSAYQVGPGPNWGSADRENVRQFQRAQGWTGDDADGYPGPETLRRLAADPKPSTGIDFTVMCWNLKSPSLLGWWPGWLIRRPRQVKMVKDFGPSVLLAQEVGSPSKVKWYDKTLGKLGLTNARAYNGSGSGKWRIIWYDPDVFERVTAGLYEMPADTLYKGDTKQMAMEVAKARATGEPYFFGSLHLENDKPADNERVAQIEACFTKAAEVAKSHGIDPARVILGGDTNSDSWVRDWVEANTDYRDAYSLAEQHWHKDTASINGWKTWAKGPRVDLVFVHQSARVIGADQRDGHEASDHNPQLFHLEI